MKLAVLACAVVLLAERPAEACSCAPPPPPCEAFSRAGAVFVGKVTNIATASGHVTVATFDIEEKLKGPVIGKTIVVHGGGMCGATFEAGKKYLVYAGNDGGTWHAGLCGRTRLLRDAKEDLAYARNRPNRSAGELLGMVQLLNEQGVLEPRAGATVVAQGTTYSAKSDQDGRYKLLVPPGKYTLDVADPGVHMLAGRLSTVELTEPSGCVSEDLVVRWNGRIRGKVVDHAGQPAASVRISAHGNDPQQLRLESYTDAGGEYEIAGVQAGTYVVAANHVDSGGPHPDSPIPPTFHPGVAVEAAAKKIAMVRSGLVEKVDIKLQKPLAIYRVTGVVKRKGRPVAGVRVRFRTVIKAPYYGRSVDATTDANGRFSFKDVAGAKVELEVCRPDAGPDNWEHACRTTKHALTGDWSVELEVPP